MTEKVRPSLRSNTYYINPLDNVQYLNFQILCTDSSQPKLYNLAPSVYSSQEAPKVDGLACSFLTSTPEAINYNDFYDACVQLLSAGSDANIDADDDGKV